MKTVIAAIFFITVSVFSQTANSHHDPDGPTHCLITPYSPAGCNPIPGGGSPPAAPLPDVDEIDDGDSDFCPNIDPYSFYIQCLISNDPAYCGQLVSALISNCDP